MKYTFLILAFSFFKLSAQITLDQWSIVAMASDGSLGNIHFSASLGEPEISSQSQGAYTFTQGFHQPLEKLEVKTKNATCAYSTDGKAWVQSTYYKNYELRWDDQTQSDSNKTLLAGKHSVQIILPSGRIITKEFNISPNSQEACELVFYSGITPNNDQKNEAWMIDGILNYPDNQVHIYDRWGLEVWQANHYDNEISVWTGNNSKGQALPAGTYFYTLEINGSDKTYKGWIQVSR